MIFRGLLGVGLVWLAVGHGPNLGLPEDRHIGTGDAVRQTSDAWRTATLKSLIEVRAELMADKKITVWKMPKLVLVAGETDGEAAKSRLASDNPEQDR